MITIPNTAESGQIAYSCVVDNHPKFLLQSLIWLRCLLTRNIPAEDIYLHVIDVDKSNYLQLLESYGVHLVHISAFDETVRYCNKLMQLDTFIGLDYAYVALMDCDTAYVGKGELKLTNSVHAKIVDHPIPPFDVLSNVFQRANLSPSPTMPILNLRGSKQRDMTDANNCNGGLYFIQIDFLQELTPLWKKWARWLIHHQALLDKWGHHADQVSFAMAMTELGKQVAHLPISWNYPIHHANGVKTWPDMTPNIIHFHNRISKTMQIQDFGLPKVDQQIQVVNHIIQSDLIDNTEPNTPSANLVFYDVAKQSQAKQAIERVPTITSMPFSDKFLSNTTINGKKRRIILHAGTSKTGTSSLQSRLFHNRETLINHGYWYPPISKHTDMPKHQYLVRVLMQNDVEKFIKNIENALRNIPNHAHTIIFTTEGIHNHWWDYKPHAKGMLRHLAQLFDLELLVWFRDPVEYATSLYTQYLKNPVTKAKSRVTYGQDIDFREAMTDEWFRNHLDYLGFYYECQFLLGEKKVIPLLYASDTISDFEQYFNLQLPRDQEKRINTSMHRPGIEITRIINRYNLPNVDKQQAVQLIFAIEQIIGDQAERFQLTDAEKDLVVQFAETNWQIMLSIMKSRGKEPSGK